MQRHLQRAVRRLDHRVDGKGAKPLHVGGTPAIEAPALFRQGESGLGPDLPLDRDDIGMAREHHPPHIHRADRGEEVGLLPAGIGQQQRLDPRRGQFRLDPEHQLQIGLGADGIKTHQPVENRTHRGLLICADK